MPRAEQSAVDSLTEYFALMEAKDYDRLATTSPTTST